MGPSGKAVVSAVAKELGSFSGQCFHLVPGDFNYEPAEFTVVITWNGGHHFAPTQILSGKDVYDFKLKVCLKHAITACNIFSEIEPDLIKEEDTLLVDSLYDMRKQLEVVKQLVSARAGNVGTSIVPDVQIPAVKPSPMTKYIPPGYVQLPFYTGGLTGDIPEDNPDIVENHPGRMAPITTRTTTFFPEIQMGPALLNRDFEVPVPLATEVEEARKRPAPAEAEDEAEEEFTYSRSTRSKKKSKDSSSSSSSAPPPPPPPPAPVPQSSAASGFTPPKKFTCIQCPYSSDRKQDYENHRNRHLGITFKCCHCKKTFYSESSRKSHIKTSHLGIKRAKCSFDKCATGKTQTLGSTGHICLMCMGWGKKPGANSVIKNLITIDHTPGMCRSVGERRTRSAPPAPGCLKIWTKCQIMWQKPTPSLLVQEGVPQPTIQWSATNVERCSGLQTP